jgi:hypothetical protein
MDKRTSHCFFTCVSSGSYESLTSAMLRAYDRDISPTVRTCNWRQFTREFFPLCPLLFICSSVGSLKGEKTVSFYLLLLPIQAICAFTIISYLLLLRRHDFAICTHQKDSVFFFLNFSLSFFFKLYFSIFWIVAKVILYYFRCNQAMIWFYSR